MPRLKGLYVLDEESYPLIYGPDERSAISRHVDVVGPPQTRKTVLEQPDLLKQVDCIFSGWSAPLLDQAFLKSAPRLRAFFYGAGYVHYCLTDAVWDRGIAVTSAIEANSVPVAEYCLATILFSLKHGWKLSRDTHAQRGFVSRDSVPGAYRSTVGLISLGRVGRILLELLAPFELNVLVYDPYLSDADARRLGVARVSLEELFNRCEVISAQCPVTQETSGMITGDHFASMKQGATFINTSRGIVVRQDELIGVAMVRQDLQFILDVVEPEPLPPESKLYTLENVFLTPHIAGSAGGECRRMGQYMVEELERYVAGEPLRWAVTPASETWEQTSRVEVTTFVRPRKPPASVS
jgi:phosphoglycerate dehydrogenase-like enzyme